NAAAFTTGAAGTGSGAELFVVTTGVSLGFAVTAFATTAATGSWTTGSGKWTGCGRSSCPALGVPDRGLGVDGAGDAGEPPSATPTPTTRTTPMATAPNTSRPFAREGSGGIGVMALAVSGLTRSAYDIIGMDDAAVEGESTAWATSDFLREVLAGDAFFAGFGRACFFALFDVRTSSSPTSANTSNIQRTRRPARSAGILIACFGIVTLCSLLTVGQFACPRFHSEKIGQVGQPVTKPSRNGSA